MIRQKKLSTCHDLSDGGLLVGLAEMALAGGIGARLELPDDGTEEPNPPPHAWLFGEDQARYIVSLADPAVLLEAARHNGIPARVIGTTGGDDLTLSSGQTISLNDLAAVHESWLPGYMSGAR